MQRAGSGAAVGCPETREQTEYLDHVAYCKRCKISGGRGRETIRHCATGELLELAAVLSALGGKRQNAGDERRGDENLNQNH